MTVVKNQDLPLAGAGHRWSADAAEKHVRRWARAEDGPNERYRRAFLWYDRSRQENFTAYKLPIADVVDGRLMAVPRAIEAAARVVQGARGGVNIPARDLAGVKREIARYYEKMGEDTPWQHAA
jgi:hypothetical protein